MLGGRHVCLFYGFLKCQLPSSELLNDSNTNPKLQTGSGEVAITENSTSSSPKNWPPMSWKTDLKAGKKQKCPKKKWKTQPRKSWPSRNVGWAELGVDFLMVSQGCRGPAFWVRMWLKTSIVYFTKSQRIWIPDVLDDGLRSGVAKSTSTQTGQEM